MAVLCGHDELGDTSLVATDKYDAHIEPVEGDVICSRSPEWLRRLRVTASNPERDAQQHCDKGQNLHEVPCLNE